MVGDEVTKEMENLKYYQLVADWEMGNLTCYRLGRLKRLVTMLG